MNKSKLTLTSICFLAIIILSTTYFISLNEPDYTEMCKLIVKDYYNQGGSRLLSIPIDEQHVDILEKDFDQYVCFWKLSLDKNDIEFCNKVNNFYLMEDCYAKFAVSKMDTVICDDLSYSNLQFRCYKDIASEKSNINLCNELPSDNKDLCIVTIALNMKDANLCDNISLNNVKIQCYLRIASETNNSKVCMKIIDDTNQEKCVRSIAKSTNNSDLCLMINSEPARNYCSAMLTEDSTFCDNIDDQAIYWQNGCYYDLAIFTNNYELCDKLTDESFKQNCNISRKSYDKYTGPTYYLLYAEVKSLEVFGVFPNEYRNDSAFINGINIYNKAVKGMDKEICLNTPLRELCLAHIAKLKSDRGICENSGETKEYCYNFFEEINFNVDSYYCKKQQDCEMKHANEIIQLEPGICTLGDWICQDNACVWVCLPT